MTTLTGTLLDSTGAPITGTLWLTLSQAATAPGPVMVSPLPPAVFVLTNGQISGPGAGPYTVYGNDVLTPAITFYRLVAFYSDGRQALRENVLVTGSTQDLGALVIAPTQSWVTGTGGPITLLGDVVGQSDANTVVKIRGKGVSAPPWTPGHVVTVQADQSLAPAPPTVGALATVVSVASDIGTADTGPVQPVLSVDVGGGGAELKLATANGDLVLMDGAARVASIGSGNGGSAKQIRHFGPFFQDYEVTAASGLGEAHRIVAKSHSAAGTPVVALNITNDVSGGGDVTTAGVYHGIQVNIGATAPGVGAELGGIVSFVRQKGVTSTSTIAYDGSVTIAPSAAGPSANVVGFNIGMKNDYAGAVNTSLVAGTFVRQAGVGTSGRHGAGTGKLYGHLLDRPAYWDYSTGTIEAVVGPNVAGSSTVWTNVPKEGGDTCSLLGKWICWTATSGKKVVKQITAVVSDTSLTVTPAIGASETVAAGAAYKILTVDPWDSAFSASGLGPSPAMSFAAEALLPPTQFAGIMAVETADPTTPATKWGWTWDGVAKFSAIDGVSSGTYAPTLTGVANVAAATAGAGHYIRIGNVVHVGVYLEIDPTSATTLTKCRITLPVPSNFTTSSDLCGHGNRDTGTAILYARVVADTGNDEAQIEFYTDADTFNRQMFCTFSYKVK